MKYTNDQEQDEYWVSISDLMSGLMMIFIFIAVSYMIQAQYKEKQERQEKEKAIVARQQEQDARKKIQMIASNYSLLQDGLYNALYEEFKDDLPKWSALIDRESLSITFQEPEVLFEQGEANLQPTFEYILSDFFPRYISILTNHKFLNDIEEIRIEGHTSSEWTTDVEPLMAYFNNMRLSQDRTRSVLEYVLQLVALEKNRLWLQERLTANGLSSSKLIFQPDGQEDLGLSRRVEFRVRTNAERRIKNILEEGTAGAAS